MTDRHLAVLVLRGGDAPGARKADSTENAGAAKYDNRQGTGEQARSRPPPRTTRLCHSIDPLYVELSWYLRVHQTPVALLLGRGRNYETLARGVRGTLADVALRRRGRFDGLVRTQLDLFSEDEAELLAEARAADDTQSRAGRDGAEELYGDYQLVVDAIAERLLDRREAYAARLEADTADEYRLAFTRAARKRFPRSSDLL